MKTFTIFTSELDDEKLAIEQLQTQLEKNGDLLKNTIGIAVCHYEFVLSGLFKAVCDALPFEVAGTISSSQATQNEADSFLFIITVMSSDDVQFQTVLTPSLLDNPMQAVTDAYSNAVNGSRPALALMYTPFILQNCGDDYVNAFDKVSDGVPFFGTMAIDDTLEFSNSFSVLNGEHYIDRMVMVLLYGKVNPKFFVANISESRILSKSALVTKSQGQILMEINDKPVMDYFEELGISKVVEDQYAMSSLPFLVDYNDGTPKVIKIFVLLTPEKYALCAGAVPEGSSLYMASTDSEDIMLTTGEALDEILANIDDASVLFAYSCVGRNMALGSEQFKEMQFLADKINTKVPFMMATSGGEICPTQISDKVAINRFHNSTFVACIL